jgi:putative molybdopterin biosynthesis protein
MGIKEFHDVVSIREAKRRLERHYKACPKAEEIRLAEAAGRVVFTDVIADIDVPPFDRASMDGYAVKAKDTFYADEEKPASLRLKGDIRAGQNKKVTIKEKEAASIATGAPVPKGANAVVMVEYTEKKGKTVNIHRPVTPGENIMAAGSDIMRGETAVRAGTVLSPRETGVLAALGATKVQAFKRPAVAIISTGDEIVQPGKSLKFGRIYDVNAQAIADAVRENGGIPEFLGIVKDDPGTLLKRLKEMMKYDIIIASGGTSAGAGDVLYRVIDKLGKPGIIVHGIAVKPGKPAIIGVANKKPIFGLPGYPTSAMITFHVLAAPILRRLSGMGGEAKKQIKAKAAMRLFSAKGRYEYMLMNLVSGTKGEYSAYPVLTGSGAITTLAEADGYVEIPENTAIIDASSEIDVTPLSDVIKPADLTIIGSHCIGVDMLLNVMNRRTPVQAKIINVGSSGGIAAARRGESDISGTHLIDEKTGIYNVPFLKKLGIADRAYLVRGYDREQGLVTARGNPHGIESIEDLITGGISFINRNPGSGTRILFDLELKKAARGVSPTELKNQIPGYEIEAKSHSAIAAAVAHGRADAGLAIRTVAHQYGLGFVPLREEKYDFAIPREKLEKPAVKRFLEALKSREFKKELKKTPGLKPTRETGKIIHKPWENF